MTEIRKEHDEVSLSAIRPLPAGGGEDHARIESPRFDARRWRRFAAIAGPYWRSEERWQAGLLIVLLSALLIGQTGFNLQFVRQSGELTSALAARDPERYWSAIRWTVVILVLAVPIWALYYYVRDTLGIRWRRWLTHRFVDAWLNDRAYYRLNAGAGIDNPDQRIAEDVATFTQQSLYFAMVALGAVIQLAAFVTLLWSISRPLVYFLVGYALFGTIVTARVFGRPLVGLNFRQLRREADFRFGLVRIREHAEPIAFSRGEADESQRLRLRFDAVFRNFRRLIRTQFGLNLFQYAFSFLTLVLPGAIIASSVLSGELEVGAAVQAGGAFAAILAAMTVVVDHFEGLSRLSAGVDRLYGFAQQLGAPADSAAGIVTVEAQRLGLESVNVDTPDRGRRLVRELSVTVEPGSGLLIAGSGGGKSSLLRAIGGLWTAGGRPHRAPAPRPGRVPAAAPLHATGQPARPGPVPRARPDADGCRAGGAARARQPWLDPRSAGRPARRARLGQGVVHRRAAAPRLRTGAARAAALRDARRGDQRAGRRQ
jgi:putative ATP-binding cassette transporter